MQVDHDFAMDDERWRPGEAANSPPPLVVVQYRRRGLGSLLMPPALIVSAAAVILAYRVQAPDWRGLKPGVSPGLARSTTARPEPTPSRPAPAEAGAEAEPIVVRVEMKPPPPAIEEPRFPPPPPIVPKAEDEAPAVPKDPTRAEVRAMNRPRPGPLIRPKLIFKLAPFAQARAAGPAPEVVAQQAWDDIRREAERKAAERAELERLKKAAPVLMQRDHRRRTVERLERARDRADADRTPFRVDLARLVELLGDRAAPRIRSLCDRYGRDTLPEIEEYVATAIGNVSRYDVRGRIEVCRRYGLPEALILEGLAQDQARDIEARDGPRDESEALVRAARALLAVPPRMVRR
jgi:hypothetical protein